MKNNLIPQDLRVGNLVELLTTQSKIVGRTGCYAEVLEIRKDKVQLKYKEHIFMRKYDSIAPIKINEELLFNFGFKLYEDDTVDYASIYRINHDDSSKDIFIIYHCNDEDLFFFKNGFNSLKHIHDLQNLYFALTGDELELIKIN